MSTVAIGATGSLVIDGQEVFPIGLSEAPPLGGKTRDGRDAWAEVASGGVNFVRTGLRDWGLQQTTTRSPRSALAWTRLPRTGCTAGRDSEMQGTFPPRLVGSRPYQSNSW
jgi:hypothetical protein